MKFKGFVFALALLISSAPLHAKNVTSGVLNFSNTASEKKLLSLNGDWEFYEGQAFTSLGNSHLRVDFIEVPSSWTKRRFDSRRLDPIGCHTYRIVITGLRPNYEYALYSRQSPANTAMIYANSQFVQECGSFSRNKEGYKAARKPLLCRMFSDKTGSIELVIQVANFTGGKGGLTTPVFFGEVEAVDKLFHQILLTSSALLGALLFIFFMNIGFWSFNRKKTANLCFGLLIFLIIVRQYFHNINFFAFLGVLPPFGLQFKLQNLVIFSSAVFALLHFGDKVFYSNHPFVDKAISTVTFIFILLFVCLPETFSVNLLDIAILWGAAFSIYALFRLALAIKKSQAEAVAYTLFYLIIAIPLTIDYYTSFFLERFNIYLSEWSTMVMVIFDIIYIAILSETMEKKTILLKNESSKYHFSIRRFIPRNLQNLIEKNIFKNMELGVSTEENMIVMFIGYEVISPDNTKISLRDQFESMGFYSATIIDHIIKNNGSVISIESQGIFAVFKSGSTESLTAAHELRDLIQTINARRAEDYYPCISFNISIHQCDILLGIVGDRTKINFSMISSGIEVTEKMRNLGFAMNIPVLISEPTIQAFGEKAARGLKLFGKIHFSEFTRPIGLYGFMSSEEEENRLENLDDAPFITQNKADKYINF